MKVFMDRLIKLIVSLTFCMSLAAACGDISGEETKDAYPLTAFAVKVGSSWYHASIDQEAKLVSVGALENGNAIADVRYTLAEGAAVSPDPSAFIGNWQQEQTLTVTCNGKATQYKVFFPDWVDAEVNVIFKDEFDVDGIPDQTRWVLCPKAGSDWNNQMSESYDQAYVEDGKLMLVAEKVNGEYKAGGIKTQGKFGFTFGKVECRARITRYPDGAFPAIWMMPQKYLYSGWPNCGEIDIMEHIKQESGIHQTLHTHYTYDLGNKTGTTKQTVCNYWDWNVYAVEWTSESLTFYVNDVMTFTYSNMHLPDEAEKMQWPFTSAAEFYLILNMGLGDNGTWAGAIDDTNLPAIMEVDWIRVSKLVD